MRGIVQHIIQSDILYIIQTLTFKELLKWCCDARDLYCETTSIWLAPEKKNEIMTTLSFSLSVVRIIGLILLEQYLNAKRLTAHGTPPLGVGVCSWSLVGFKDARQSKYGSSVFPQLARKDRMQFRSNSFCTRAHIVMMMFTLHTPNQWNRGEVFHIPNRLEQAYGEGKHNKQIDIEQHIMRQHHHAQSHMSHWLQATPSGSKGQKHTTGPLQWLAKPPSWPETKDQINGRPAGLLAIFLARVIGSGLVQQAHLY